MLGRHFIPHIDRDLDPLLSPQEVSQILGWSLQTLKKKRRTGDGPNFVRLSSRRVAYRRGAVECWLRDRSRSQT